jgi:hypothetical protein
MTTYRCTCCTFTVKGCVIKSDKFGRLFCAHGTKAQINHYGEKEKKHLIKIEENEKVQFT